MSPQELLAEIRRYAEDKKAGAKPHRKGGKPK